MPHSSPSGRAYPQPSRKSETRRVLGLAQPANNQANHHKREDPVGNNCSHGFFRSFEEAPIGKKWECKDAHTSKEAEHYTLRYPRHITDGEVVEEINEDQ